MKKKKYNLRDIETKILNNTLKTIIFVKTRNFLRNNLDSFMGITTYSKKKS